MGPLATGGSVRTILGIKKEERYHFTFAVTVDQGTLDGLCNN